MKQDVRAFYHFCPLLLIKGNSEYNDLARKLKLPLNNSLSKIRIQYREKFENTDQFSLFFQKGAVCWHEAEEEEKRRERADYCKQRRIG